MTRWWVQVRALVAIGLLVLFAGMSIVLACAFAVLAFWLQGNSPVSWAWLRYLSAAAALVFLVCTIPVRALRRGGKDPGGIPVSKSEAPELWALVHAIADATRTRPPDEIRLVAEPNAFAAEGGRPLGLRARKRYLLLGAPVVAVLTDRQLAAVVSHEFGHYSDQDTIGLAAGLPVAHAAAWSLALLAGLGLGLAVTSARRGSRRRVLRSDTGHHKRR
ncbi:M48 family metallopeptidase [Streptomyces avermitilis]|uniref:M48 family metallopeptidase n=1 Tax=Streptomyces avermitilis TaxID=33903 RepID=UPI00339EE7B3